MPKSSGGGEQYFERSPASRSDTRSVGLRLPDVSLELASDTGVFSSQRIDRGTLILLEHAPRPPEAGEILDLGCGYGPIAITAAMRSPKARVWAVDVNERALELTRSNAAAAGIANVEVVSPEEVPSDLRFDAIYSNPPVRIGKKPMYELLESWFRRLTPQGKAWLVVQKHLGSDSLSAWLESKGFVVTRLKSKSSFRVIEVSPV